MSSLPPPPPAGPYGGVVVPGGHVLASPWSRIGARFIDALILGIGSTLLFASFWGGEDFTSGNIGWGATVLSLFVAVAYEVGFVGTMGATPGKLALGLRIVTQEDGTTPPGWDKAVLRYAPDLVVLVPYIGTLGSLGILVASLIWLGTDDYRRTVYDRVATTYVIKV
jgi:uncharacterized RDD family membrane protein YckC